MSQMVEEQPMVCDKYNVKMNFRVISKRPQSSNETAEKKRRDIQQELYQIFKNYE